ncbi:hypothetical protein VE03_09755 [Pseudogymnoascus sp. 23342-1-I1]|nr:hypothetical protein VE03_09755 [Pseudogymnoascus sp. 23342-1-I1]
MGLDATGREFWKTFDPQKSERFPSSKKGTINKLSRTGKSIGREELFAYTNGHFLIDEQRQLELRYVKFDVDALCDVSAAAGPESSPVTAIEKMEGGFSKAFLMKRKNGTEVIAKLPCRNAGPPKSTTASEVAILQYIRHNTDIPVPAVYSWSSNISNPVGAEYIVMEEARGVQLFKQWGEMTQLSKLELIKGLTILEHQLACIRLPAYGSLYLRDSCPDLVRYQPLDTAGDSSGSYCVGPSCERAYMLEPDVSSMKNMDKGPWTSISAFGKAIANTQINRITREVQVQLGTFYHGTSAEQIDLLQDTIEIMELLHTHPILSRHAQPILWHSDLHMGNIFISPDDPSRIVSLIDWQSISILPAFLQEKWPVFLKPPSNYPEWFVQPTLPDDFENLDSGDKALATLEWNQATRAKAYEVSNFLENRPAHNAMNVPRVFKGFSSDVAKYPIMESYHYEPVLLKYSKTGFQNELLFQDYHAWHEVQELAKTCLDTDSEGWITPKLDFEEKQRQNKELLGMFIERMADKKTASEATRMWPFSNGL